MSYGNEFYKEISISSSKFTTGTLNRPIIKFGTFMDDLDYIQIERIVMPTTYYVFTSPSYVSCSITVGGSTTAVSWAAGNYTPAEWIAVVQPQVTGLTITYSPITNKLTFVGTGNVTVTFSATQFAYELLGMNAGANTSGSTTFVTPNVVAFSGPNVAYLHAKVASMFNDESLYFSRVIGDTDPQDKFLMIPIDVNRNSVVIYEAVERRYFEWLDSATREMEMYFTLGDRAELMDFNGQPFQIKLAGYAFENPVGKATRHIKYTTK